MPNLFNRAAAINIAGQRYTDLQIEFEVESTIKPEPNPGRIKVYNLAQTTRQRINDEGKRLRVLLEAGYKANLEQLYVGSVRRSFSHRAGTDWITEFECGDGEDQIRQSRFKQSYPSGTKADKVMQDLINSTGLSIGNLQKTFKEKGISAGLQEFAKGYAAIGNAHEQIEQLSRSVGLQVSVQDETYQAVEFTSTTPETAFVLSPSSGLIGSPEPGKKGEVKARCLLIPSLRAGRRVVLKSASAEGVFRIQRVTHSGSLRSGDWQSDLELKSVN